MTEEKIKQDEELLKKLRWLKDQKRRWKQVEKLKVLNFVTGVTMVM